MSETMTAETISVVEETPKESALKRFAKAFYAKVKAAKDRVVAFFGENETPVREDEGTARKVARVITAVPKWAGHTATTAARTVLWTVQTLISGVVLGLVTVALAALFIAAVVMLTAYKAVQLLSLILRTPYLIVRGDDCLKTDWVGYANLWKPRYFFYTKISQVFAAQAAAEQDLWTEATEEPVIEPVAEPVLTVVKDRTKHEPTPKQEKNRPARMPILVGADA